MVGLTYHAGIREIRSIINISDDEWLKVVDVNLNGAFFCIKRTIPYMIKQNWGRILNIASSAGIIAVPKRPAYTATKHAIIGLTKEAAGDLGQYNITVNALAPGLVETPLTSTYFGEEDLVSSIRKVTPLRRWAIPEEIASVALFLVSEAATFISGCVLPVDGGFTATKSMDYALSLESPFA